MKEKRAIFCLNEGLHCLIQLIAARRAFFLPNCGPRSIISFLSGPPVNFSSRPLEPILLNKFSLQKTKFVLHFLTVCYFNLDHNNAKRNLRLILNFYGQNFFIGLPSDLIWLDRVQRMTSVLQRRIKINVQ